MSGLGIIGAALAAGLSGAGEGMSQGVAEQMKEDARLKEIQTMQDAELMKAKAIAQFSIDAQNAPANRAGALVRDAAQQSIPVAPASVTQLTGADSGAPVDDSGNPMQGIVGNANTVNDIRQRAMMLPDSDPNKAPLLAQLNRQMSTEQATAQAAVAGQTRTPTTKEAMESAYQAAIAKGDMQAAATIKAALPDKVIKLGDGETLLDAATNTPIYSNSGKSDRQDKQLSMQMELERMKEANRNALEERKLDPLGLNGGAMGVGAPVGGSVGATNTTSQLGPAAQAIQDGLHGDDLLQKIPTPIGQQVRALAEGRMQFPAGFAMKSPYWQEMVTLVSQYDPTFDGANFNKRSQTAIAFSKGKQADAVRAANQTIAHMGSLYDTIDKLDNFDGAATPLNYVVNPVESLFGDARQGVFKQQAQAVASELRKVFSGSGGGSLQELKAWEDSLPVNASKTQQQAYLQSGSHLLQGAIDALNTQYKEGMGLIANKKPLISPKAQAVLDKIQGNESAVDNSTPTVSTDGWSNLRVN